MKFAFITDTHIGARGGSSVFREYFTFWFREVFFPALKKEGIDTVYCLGDFFDNRNHMNLNDIFFVLEVFVPLLKEYDINFFVLAGNHDLAYKNSNKISSLTLLRDAAPNHVTLVKDEVTEFDLDGHRFVMVPWINNNNYEEIMTSISEIEDKGNVRILGHFEIKGMMMYKNSIPCDHGLDPKVFKEFKSVWSGHFHHPSSYTNIEYLGAAFHLNWQDYGDVRGWWIYDSEKDEKVHMENNHSLFNVVKYEDDMFKSWDEEELEAAFSNQFVILRVDSEFSKVKLKDAIRIIQENKPIKLDIQNNYITATKTNTDASGEEESVNVAETQTYIEDYVGRNVRDDLLDSVRARVSELYEKSNEIMAKGE